MGEGDPQQASRRRRPGYADVMSTLAVFLALAGGSYAVANVGRNSVGPREIKRDAVRSGHIKDGHVTFRDIRPGHITTHHIRDGHVTRADIRDGNVLGQHIADGAVGSTEIAGGAVGGAEVADDSLSGADIDESRLGKVPTADSVDGYDMAPLTFAGDPGASQVVFERAGLRIRAECITNPFGGPGIPSLLAEKINNDNGVISASAISDIASEDSGGDTNDDFRALHGRDEDFDQGDVVSLLPGDASNTRKGVEEFNASFTYRTLPGRVVTATYGTFTDSAAISSDCVIAGNVVISPLPVLVLP